MNKLKLIGIALGVLLIGLVVYLVFQSEKPFEPIDLSFSTNTVLNYSSVAYLDTIAHVGLDELDIQNIEVMLLDISQSVMFTLMPGNQVNGFVIQLSDTTYQVFINPKMSRPGHINITAHELIHVHQNITETLVVSEYPIMMWKGSPVNVTNLEHKFRPWEIDAYNREQELEWDIRKRLY